MRTWFAKVVDNKIEQAITSEIPTTTEIVESSEPSLTDKPPRRLVYAPMRTSASVSSITGGVRIKARIDSNDQCVVLMLDRHLLSGCSFWCDQRADAAMYSPLAATLFEQENLASVLIHEMNVTVKLGPSEPFVNDDTARRLGQAIRSHLVAELPVITEDYLAKMPSEDQIRDGLQEVIDNEINPGIANHSGTITLTAVKGNTAYIKMGGGCQGCAASGITLRQGVETSFRIAVPHLGALLDETDHTAGTNPFFTDLHSGMGA